MEISLAEIARTADGKVIGDPSTSIRGVNSLDAAGPGDITFLTDRRYEDKVAGTKASAIIVSKEHDLFKGPQVVVLNPALGYARVSALFASPVARFPGISEQSIVHNNSHIGKDVSVYPMVYVGEGAIIGDHVTLYPGVFIGERVRVGDRTVIYPNVSILKDCLIGNDVIIHAGTVIGSDGFGFVRDGATSVKILQLGIVQIDDEVEIGANSCIDRASLGRTWIRKGVKIDNLVQIAHNVSIGEDTVIVAQVGISGSVDVGKEVILAGQVGIADHLEIGDKVMIGPQSGVAKSIPPGEVVSGTPTMPHRLWLKVSGLKTRLPRMNERLRHLEKRLEGLKRQIKQG